MKVFDLADSYPLYSHLLLIKRTDTYVIENNFVWSFKRRRNFFFKNLASFIFVSAYQYLFHHDKRKTFELVREKKKLKE